MQNFGNMHSFMYSTSHIKASCITCETKSVQNVISGISPTLFENVSACTLQQKGNKLINCIYLSDLKFS